MYWNAFVEILLVAVVSPFLTFFLDDCMSPGMIFHKWFVFVQGKYWLKPLGGCMKCTNFWITIIMYVLFQFNPLIFGIFALIGISNWIQTKLWT